MVDNSVNFCKRVIPETTNVYMNDMEIIVMTKKLPHGHNIGGGNSQKRRQEYKKEKNSE